MKSQAHKVVDNLVPENRDELPLKMDQIVNVIKQEPAGWWLAQDPVTNKLGWAPADFLKRK